MTITLMNDILRIVQILKTNFEFHDISKLEKTIFFVLWGTDNKTF